MNKIAIIVAGGSGSRMQSDLPKQFLPLGGQPLIIHTAKAFIEAYHDIKIIIVLPEAQLGYGASLFKEAPYYDQIQLVQGGNSRFASVQKGIAAIAETDKDCIVFVHDGVRCLVSPELIKRCFNKAIETGSAIPVIPATDSMRMLESNDPSKSQHIDRENIRLVQTPQTFKYALLKEGFKQDYRSSFTDEASVLEAMGKSVSLVEGDVENIKITRPIDLIIAGAIFQKRVNKH